MPTYYSYHGRPLVFSDEVVDLPVLTVEICGQWGTLHAVHRVEPTSEGVLLEHTIKAVRWPDEFCNLSVHLPNPKLIEEWGYDQGYVWDEPSLDMIYGRWYRDEVLNK